MAVVMERRNALGGEKRSSLSAELRDLANGPEFGKWLGPAT